MGTRGYKIVRYDGRSFVFLNERDSYPARFGQEIVDGIPVDENGYQSESFTTSIYAALTSHIEWLKTQRKFFAKMTKEIEEHALILDGKQLSDYLHIRGLDVDRFPTGLVELSNEDSVGWTYTVDLDREIFSVWDSAHFKLNKIPRDGVWIHALKKDERRRYTVNLGICPAECVAAPEMERPRMLKDEAIELRGAYALLEPKIVNANAKIDNGRHHAHQCFHALTYVSFCESYFDNFARYGLRWEPLDFIFRELAFVMLSLAAGKVQFAYSPSPLSVLFQGNWKDYGKVEIDKGKGVDGEDFVPLFPVGSHIRGQEPGSAPEGTMYWFEDVLVSLATDLDDRVWLETHVAKVVKYALWFEKRSFEAVITDLMFVVLLDVHVTDSKTVVRHTMPLQLFPINRSDHLSTHPRERPPCVENKVPVDEAGSHESNEAQPDRENPSNQPPPPSDILIDRTFPPQGGQALLSSSDLYRSEANLTKYIPGFIALQNFLHKAKSRSFDRNGVGRGVLPTEILNYISDYLDYDTHHASMDVNAAFRAYCFRHFSVHGLTVLEKVEFPNGGGDGGDLPVLTFADFETGEQKRFVVYRDRESYPYRLPVRRWCPVVGEGDRRSAVPRVGQRFMLVAEGEDNGEIDGIF